MVVANLEGFSRASKPLSPVMGKERKNDETTA
jgi:hypothetical protein